MKENDQLTNNKPIPISILSIGIGMSIGCVIYAIINRTYHDFLKYSFYISSTIGLILFIIGIVYFFKNGIRKPTINDFIIVVITFFILLLIIGPSYYGFGVVIKDLYLWLQSPKIPREWAVPIVSGITIIVGLFLFYFRLRARSIYGFTEVIVGLSIAIQKASTENYEELNKSSFYLAVLTASIYLFVRGLDNIHQGITKEPFDYYALKIYDYLNRNKGR